MYDAAQSQMALQKTSDSGYFSQQSFNDSLQLFPQLMLQQFMANQSTEVANNTVEIANNAEQAEEKTTLPPIFLIVEPPFQIAGRLGLLNNNATYRIQLEEIRRRLGTPERLNISYINGIVRKAKGMDAGKILHDILKQNGVDVPHGQRTNIRPTCFLPLCEDETKKMADDFSQLTQKFFPRKAFRQVLKDRIAKNRTKMQQDASLLRHFLTTGEITDEFLRQSFELIPQQLVRIFNEDKTLEIQRRRGSVNGPKPLDKDLQLGLWDLNLATHNFAGIGIRGAIAPFCSHRP